eukprot:m.444497 g.444497  ORF g.444497 m.444497 type:complete len:199 (-) comp19107_c0_seq1:1311-1907(-)
MPLPKVAVDPSAMGFGGGQAPPPMSLRVFKKYDKDGSGQIDFKELRHLCYDMGHPLTDEQIETARHVLDADGNGVLSYKEFKAWWASSDRYEQLEAHEQASIENKQYGEWMEGVIAHFKYFDKDHSGFVEGDEWDAMHKHLSDGGYPVGTVEEGREKLDFNHDGKISMQEYVKWLVELKYGAGFFESLNVQKLKLGAK